MLHIYKNRTATSRPHSHHFKRSPSLQHARVQQPDTHPIQAVTVTYSTAQSSVSLAATEELLLGVVMTLLIVLAFDDGGETLCFTVEESFVERVPTAEGLEVELVFLATEVGVMVLLFFEEVVVVFRVEDDVFNVDDAMVALLLTDEEAVVETTFATEDDADAALAPARGLIGV